MGFTRTLSNLTGPARVGALLNVTTGPPTYHPPTTHNHAPSGRWWEIQKDPRSNWQENAICSRFTPAEVIGAAIQAEFGDKPLGLKHLNWYLWEGGGADYVEDATIDALLRTDDNVRRVFKNALEAHGPAAMKGVVTGQLSLSQGDYSANAVGQDFRFALGAIDQFDYVADFTAGTFHAWFQDFYEWHPVYPGLYLPTFPDDEVRPTNCVHAAAVELKLGSARDYWMKGEATVPLSVILSAPKRPLLGGGGGNLGLDDDL